MNPIDIAEQLRNMRRRAILVYRTTPAGPVYGINGTTADLGVLTDAADLLEQQRAADQTTKLRKALTESAACEMIELIAEQHKLKADLAERRSAASAPSAAPAGEPVAGPVQLDIIEQYRMQMAGISTAAHGYWKAGDPIHPDYDTPALRDVAKLCADYAQRSSELDQLRARVAELEAAAPAPADEPVAWTDADAICNAPDVDEAIRTLLDDQTGDNAVEVVRAILRYAQPAAARVPLTDEQIVSALQSCDAEDHTQAGWVWRQRIKWARAIERAHGITATSKEGGAA